VIEDRARAIHAAMRLAGAGDVVVIAGKGHETYQIIGDTRFTFNDRQVAAQALEELGYTPASTAPL
jgi:UDP-N-acetylmuramoyl-L-alanyl-D-glutamate--2,6-diaminopimelate ligase